MTPADLATSWTWPDGTPVSLKTAEIEFCRTRVVVFFTPVASTDTSTRSNLLANRWKAPSDVTNSLCWQDVNAVSRSSSMEVATDWKLRDPLSNSVRPAGSAAVKLFAIRTAALLMRYGSSQNS